MRLSEILGALHYLRELCKANEGQLWRLQMTKLIEAEAPSDNRKAKMIANFNNGMVLPIQQPISARPIARPMSSPISTSDNGFLNEGYNSENPANYNI